MTTNTSSTPMFTRREWLYVGLVILATLLITGIPYLYAYFAAPDDQHFMGVALNIPDHFQYFSWLRESQDKILVPNQLTPEYSTPLLFNFLWWMLGRIQAITGLDYRALYQITRILASAFVMIATYFFCGVVFTNRTKRWTAFLVATFMSGLGWILVVEKTLRRLPDINSPFAIYTSEPNTFLNMIGFPHFAIAAGLIALIFGVILLGQRSKNIRYAWLAAALSLFLSVQHAYDMFIIYPVIGLYALFIWIRDRKFPMYLFKLGVIVVLISMWPALQAFYITNADPVWKGVLAQFDNAGAWSPAPYLLPILMGIAWILAIWALDIRTPWRDRDDTHLFIMAWFLSHFILIYIPLNFQIHLFSGWQVIIGVLATIGLYTRVLPFLQKRFPNRSRASLIRWATVGLLVLIIPTNLYLLAWRFLDMRNAWQESDTRTAEIRYFIPTSEYDALKFLETQVQGDDVVLASLDLGQFVPALTGARTFIGHWAQTLDFYGKRDLVSAFFNSALSDEDRQKILDTYNVTYVIYSPQEAKQGDYDPASASYLEMAYDAGGVRVFKVTSNE
ncbi:MAG: hypothetical protein K8L97_19780 [Anaerolineae bacterium]|nr:hypothetical protein [Anaerolineae bacterium]